ncbi:MAG: rRNA maturation RNase YbeY [Bacteroidetes bacterium]|nr:rRNA maturation RNase YbeY [Bacteroidota bacterium]
MISFHFQMQCNLKDRIKLKAFINNLIKKEGYIAGDISFVFCSDDYILDINREFLDHNYPTDIITFDYHNKKQLNAEIYISLDTIRENSKFFKSEFNKELHRVIFHGILHLCKYKDKTQKEKELMRKMEDFYLDKYFNVSHDTVSP